MLVVFLGPPGCGKGTQAKIISDLEGFKHVSTGDMLREVSKSGTELGKNLSEIMKNGMLVTDDLVNQIVKESLTGEKLKEKCILDGYPRTLAQAEYLEGILHEEYKVINFKIDKERLKQRIESRFVCEECGQIYNELTSPTFEKGVCDKCKSVNFQKRADDNEASLIKRIEAYEDQVFMILDYYYKKNKLFNVKADQDVETVTKQIVEAIKKD